MSCVASLALGALVSVSVRVETSSVTNPLWQGRIVERLVQEGHTAVPAGHDSDVVLRIYSTDRFAWVESDEKTVALDAPASALRDLELLHRAALLARRPGQSPGRDRRTIRAVTVQIDAEDAATFARVAQACLRAGYAVTRHTPDRRLCVSRGENGIKIGYGRARCESGFSTSEAKISNDVAVTLGVLDVPDIIAGPAAPLSSSTELTTVAPSAAPPSNVHFSVAAGPWIRDGGTDAQVVARALYGDLYGWAGFLAAGVVSAGNDIASVVEADARFGLRYSVRIYGPWSAFVAPSIGVRMHRFDVEGSQAGVRWDVAARVPLGVRWAVFDTVSAEASIFGDLSGRNREHRRDAERLWYRSAAGGGALVAIAYGFSL